MGTKIRALRLAMGIAASLAMVGGVAGCGLASGITVVGSNPATGTLANPTAVDAASSTQPETCSTLDLSLNVFALSPGAASPPTPTPSSSTADTRTLVLKLAFTNVSRFACSLRGYPSVDFLRFANDGPLSAPDTFSPGAATRVLLPPDASAGALVTFVTNGPANPDGLHCDQAVAVRAFPPGSSVALAAGIRPAVGETVHDFSVCDHEVTVGPVQPWVAQ